MGCTWDVYVILSTEIAPTDHFDVEGPVNDAAVSVKGQLEAEGAAASLDVGLVSDLYISEVGKDREADKPSAAPPNLHKLRYHCTGMTTHIESAAAVRAEVEGAPLDLVGPAGGGLGLGLHLQELGVAGDVRLHATEPLDYLDLVSVEQ